MVIAEEHTVSPQHGSICKLAAESLEKMAKRMKEDAFKKMGGKDQCFFVGEMVWVPLSDFDKAKVDNQCLTGVIVKINQAIFKACIVV
jgi:hypothetical protein